MRRRKVWLLSASLVAAILQVGLMSVAKMHLPYSPIRGALFDALAMPGAVAGGLFYPEGIHSDGNVVIFLYIVVVVNFVIYWSFWFLALWVASRVFHKRRSAPRS